jgi:hypothetical protein
VSRLFRADFKCWECPFVIFHRMKSVH